MSEKPAHTQGPWFFACDSYGKVQHSNMAAVAAYDGPRVASRIKNWGDAYLIAQAPRLLARLTELEHLAGVFNDRQHAGLDITPVMWSTMYRLCGEAKTVINAARGDGHAELALRGQPL